MNRTFVNASALSGWLFRRWLAPPMPGLCRAHLFGDSLSDTGNNALAFDAVGGLRASSGDAAPHAAEPADIIPTYPYASDRYSNGPVWADYFANVLGVTLLPSSPARGTNYAHGGARTVMGAAPAFRPASKRRSGSSSRAAPVLRPMRCNVIAGGGNDARDVLTGADAATTVSELWGAPRWG